MSASDDEEAGEEAQAASASSAEEDIDELGDDLGASSGGSEEQEEEEEEEDEGAAGINPGSTNGNPAAAKRQKTGVEMNGLGSVGWDASDEEEDQAVQADTGTVPPPFPPPAYSNHKTYPAASCDAHLQ